VVIVKHGKGSSNLFQLKGNRYFAISDAKQNVRINAIGFKVFEDNFPNGPLRINKDNFSSLKRLKSRSR
jgi:hypothetical protein